MATYKAVMRPALEYASSVWSPIASSTSINKLQVMQNAALRTATGCTQDTNIQHLHDETLAEHLIVSRHLATRGNNKILHTPPPHISSSEERLPRLTHHTLAQLRTNKSPFLKSYLPKVDAKSHPSPLCPLCNTHTHHLFNCTTLSPLDLWTDPAGVINHLIACFWWSAGGSGALEICPSGSPEDRRWQPP